MSWSFAIEDVRAKYVVPIHVSGFVLFVVLTSFHFSSYEFEWVTTWMRMYAAGVATSIAFSSVLFLVLPFRRAPRGWLRVAVAGGTVITLIQLVWAFLSDRAILVSYPDLRDFLKVISPNSFGEGLKFIVTVIAETTLRACLAFGAVFCVGNATLWIRRGFDAKPTKREAHEQRTTT
jgi:predicted small integral membrane protein